VSKDDNVHKPHPKVKITTHIGNTESTHGGVQKKESHYATVISNALNKDPATTYSAKRKR
jgi:hypothetical protein